MDDATKLDLLQSHAEQFRCGVTVSSISAEVQTQFQKLFDLSEQVYQAITQRRILNGLAFKDIHGRFKTVDIAHYKTFEWNFEDRVKVEDRGDNRSASESFIH